MMGLLHTTTRRLMVTLAAALCLAGLGAAAAEGGRKPAGWIEKCEPKEAFAEGKIEVHQSGKKLEQCLQVPLFDGDIVRIKDADAALHYLDHDRRPKVLTKGDMKGGSWRAEAAEGDRATLLGNLVGLFKNHEAEGGTAIAATRGGGEAGQPPSREKILIYPVDDSVALKLAAGERSLHVYWSGGKDKETFNVRLLQNGKVLAKVDAAEKRSAVLPSVSFIPGEWYELVVEGNVSGSTSDVLGVESAAPPMPQPLVEAQLPQEMKQFQQLLYAIWLAEEEGGAWLPEAQQIAAALAASYPPAQQWLERLWGGE